MQTMPASSRSVMIGMVSLQAAENVAREMNAYEDLLQKKIASVLRYVTWEELFPEFICNSIAQQGAAPLLVWMPDWPTRKGDSRRECSPDDTGLNEILAGMHDEYIEQFAEAIHRWGRTLMIRFLYEFNANWYVWSGYKNGGPNGGPDKVKRVWLYVVGKFRELGVRNVQWVWCVHEPSTLVSREPWNAIEQYWPGDEWVDWLGIDGFNFYPENPERTHPAFLSFDDCFGEMYRQLCTLSDKPIQIMTGTGEFVCEHPPVNKADWVIDMCAKLQQDYMRIALYYWFHHRFNDRADWRINSSPKSLAAFRLQMQASYFSSSFHKEENALK